MKINRIFDYKKLDRVTNKDGTRFYLDPAGNRCPSVTTILSATACQPELIAWQERVGLAEATRVRDEATGLGSLMHTHLECYVEGIDRPSGSNMVRQLAKNMADQIINRGLINVDEVWGMEESLYFPELWAGTADLCGIYKGQPAIMDYKTTKKMKSRAMIRDYQLQLCAYSMSHDEIYGTDIKQGIIFMVGRDLQFEEFVFDKKEFKDAQQEWIARVELFLQKTNQI